MANNTYGRSRSLLQSSSINSLQRPLECLVEDLDESVSLGVVQGGLEIFHLQQLTEVKF